MIRKHKIDSGPIHTIVVDADSTVFCSDEFNNEIFAFDAAGKVLWRANGFRYPRGLALGWLKLDNIRHRCLGVCDSWNDQVVFLDLGGKVLGAWNHAGHQQFSEVSDILFFPAILGEAHGILADEPVWLLLDRGNHRLCVLNCSGELRQQIGRALPPTIDMHWTLKPPDACLDAGQNESCGPTMDALYYPSLLLGRDRRSLFVWEPLRQKVKQLVARHLLSIALSQECTAWISADQTGFLGFDSKGSRLHRYDENGEPTGEWAFEGRPVHSQLPLGKVWIQHEDSLQLTELEPRRGERSEHGPFALLRITAEAEFKAFDVVRGRQKAEDLAGCAQELVDLADRFMAEIITGPRQPESMREHYARLVEIENRRRMSERSLSVCCSRMLHRLWTLRMLPKPMPIGERAVQDVRQVLYSVNEPLLRAFPAVATSADNLFLTDFSDSAGPASEKWDSEQNLGGRLFAEMQAFLALCNEWDRGGRLAVTSGCATESHVLRESSRIRLGVEDGSPARPYGLAEAPGGGLFVSLPHHGVLVRCDRAGNPLGELTPGGGRVWKAPTGIAVDADGQLWGVDSDLGIVFVLDPDSGRMRTLTPPEKTIGALSIPVGICRGPGRSMLVADTRKHRILRITLEGVWGLHSSPSGIGPGQFRHPESLCTSGETAETWVVDHRNHRVQKLGSRGEFLAQVGQCGLDKGQMYLPESVAILPDGTLAVAQGHFHRCIKLFTPDGTELEEHLLDYAPGGMLARQSQLLVANFDGDHIRVYERTT
ncbi:MAG TPA: NHL repeat-containing protein [Acidobacteriota bacterium]|nr:NHL repeat-containing protein [Acidobacteriota bacterium]